MLLDRIGDLLVRIEDELPATPEDVAESDMGPLRARIDAIDLLLLQLMNARARAANSIGHIKKCLDLPIYAPRREQQVIGNVISANEGPLSTNAVRRLFERLIDETRSLERQNFQDDTPLDGTT